LQIHKVYETQEKNLILGKVRRGRHTKRQRLSEEALGRDIERHVRRRGVLNMYATCGKQLRDDTALLAPLFATYLLSVVLNEHRVSDQTPPLSVSVAIANHM